jgi:methylaspartate ammonia-lyase
MIANRLAVLPHGQIENTVEQFGQRGETFLDFVQFVVELVKQTPGYVPALHFDLHGALGNAFNYDSGKEFNFLEKLIAVTGALPLRLESPYLENSQERHIERTAQLRRGIAQRGLPIEIVADEWVNNVNDVEAFIAAEAADRIHIKMPNFGSLTESVKAALLCRAQGIKTLLGGSCVETDLSTRLTVHTALAIRPDGVLVKPGMGINEGISLMRNEAARTLCEIARRPKKEWL